MNRQTVNKSVLLLVVFFISSIFFSMIRGFLMALFLAGLFSALLTPVYRRFENWFGGRRSLASLTTVGFTEGGGQGSPFSARAAYPTVYGLPTDLEKVRALGVRTDIDVIFLSQLYKFGRVVSYRSAIKVLGDPLFKRASTLQPVLVKLWFAGSLWPAQLDAGGFSGLQSLFRPG